MELLGARSALLWPQVVGHSITQIFLKKSLGFLLTRQMKWTVLWPEQIFRLRWDPNTTYIQSNPYIQFNWSHFRCRGCFPSRKNFEVAEGLQQICGDFCMAATDDQIQVIEMIELLETKGSKTF
ncbi:uncharacterized protein [Malus domestica]|uniref:uncharacterized protein isoform X1 n=1 Tax=Malus domestica TaxID=3750 RepID=UPI0010AA1474|nr:uncharacterized protein LOC103432097 isoform X2 [Malus domestica]